MRKILVILFAIATSLSTFANTNTNSYVSVGIGLYDARDSYGYDYDNSDLYAVSLGKYFNEKKCVLELEVNTTQFEFEESFYVDGDSVTTTTVVDNNDGTPEIVPVKPGKGGGHAWGWYRKNPPIPAVPSTFTTNSVVTTSSPYMFTQDTKVRLTSALVNAEYRLVNRTQLVPYASIGCGVTYAQVDFNLADDYTETGFTYQGGVGVDIESKNGYVAIDLGARYFRTMFESDFDIYGLQYIAGLKFNF